MAARWAGYQRQTAEALRVAQLHEGGNCYQGAEPAWDRKLIGVGLP